ncbi:MAG: sodium:solute symporter family protein [Methanomicrobiales archaeon]|nr:sodium:solute symporter family protein [Methanomicrobiales archaeon]
MEGIIVIDPIVLAVIVAIYVSIVIYLGYIGYRKTKGSEDFLVAGRKIHPALLGLSYGATFISTSAIVGFGGIAAQLGMGLIWLTVLCVIVGVLIAFIVFGKKTREIGSRLQAVTYPDLMGKCYNSPTIQRITCAVIIAGMPIYTAAILIGGARFIETSLSVQYDVALLGFAIIVSAYVILGGLIAVIYTDVMQGVIMLIGMSILLVLTYVYLGGVTAAHSALDAMRDLVPAVLAETGMTGWTSMPLFLSPMWQTVITTMVLGVGIGVLAQPQLVVRFLTVKDDASIRRAIMFGGPFILITTGVAFTIGPLTNVWFMREFGMLAVDAAGGNVDSVIPLFITSSMPDIFVVIFMLALLSAAMSTLSALYHTMGTTIGYDIGKELCDGQPSMRLIQVGTGCMIIVSTVIAYLMPANIIARATVIFMGLCTATLLPAYAHAMYSPRPSPSSAKVSMIVGAIFWLLWTVFVHVKESSVIGLSKLLFGVPTISETWAMVDPIAVALPISALTLLCMLAYERVKSGRRKTA